MATSDDLDEMRWKTAAQELQQTFCNQLGDREWDIIEKGEPLLLLQKVGFGVYGRPPEEPTKKNKFTGYVDDQLQLIEDICNQLNKINGSNGQENIFFSCIFVTGKISNDRFTHPVFRTRKKTDESALYFVDTSCRVYSSWSDYLENNTLPECTYCYPRDGHYIADANGEVIVDFGTTPASKATNKILSALDTVATVVTWGAMAVGLVTLSAIPVAGPIVAAATVAGVSSGVYGAGRSVANLVDRGMHEQSIGLDNMESIGCWLSIVGGSLGAAQGPFISSITKSARAGEVMGKASRIAFVAVNTGSLTVNGFGILYGLADIVIKSERNELTPLDVFQFSVSCLFFSNAVINVKTASTIIKETQREIIGQHRAELSPAALKLFNKHTGKIRGPDEMHGNARVIRTLKRINNKAELYELMAHPDVDNRKVKLFPDGLKGLLNVNKEFKVHPNKYLEMSPATRQQILEATQQLKRNPTQVAEFKTRMARVCKENRINFECMRKEAVENLCKVFREDSVKDIVINSKRLFFDMKPHEIDRVAVVLTNAGKNYNRKMLKLAIKFSASRGCKTVGDFCSFMEYSSYYVSDMMIKSEMRYKTKLTAAKESPTFKEITFNKEYGIDGKRKAYFEKEALRSLRNEGSPEFKEMTQHFELWKEAVGRVNRQTDPRFASENAATYHYLKHQDFGPAGKLSVEQYFKIASELVNDTRNQTNSMLTQEGTCTIVTFKNPVNGAFGVRIDRVQDGQVVSGIATVFYVRNND